MPSRTSYRRKPKFTVGEFLTDPQQVIAAVNAGKWLYFGTDHHARAYAACWIANMNFSCVMRCVAGKQLAFANRNAEYPYVFKAKWRKSHAPERSGEWLATCSEVPQENIVEITKDAVALRAEQLVIKHAGKSAVRVIVHFELPERTNAPVAL